jgi:uncharacterized protein (DUF1778 family)
MPVSRKKQTHHRASERLEARVTGEQKRFFQRAAAVRGVTLTDFVIESVQQAAAKAVQENDVLVLPVEDRDRFVAALMSPPVPNLALRRAARRYMETMSR